MGGIVIVDSVSGGTTDGANKDLSNLTITGEARFTAKAGVDLDNISSAGVSVITSYATGGGANTDLSNLSVTGQAVIDGKADTDLDNLTVTGEAKFKAPALISSDADNGLTSGTDDKLYIDVNVSGKANTELDNITSAGTSVITSLIASNITGKANTDLDNLSVTGQAVIDGKANVSLNNLTSAGTSVITSLVASGITGKANVDLDNLSVTGEARFTAKAGVDLDNISSAGVSVIQSYATGGGANTDLSNLSVTGQAVIDGKANTNLMNTNFITNGILSAPNGVATYSGLDLQLPAGTVLACPDGINADGTRKSIVVTTASLLTVTTTAVNGVWFKAYYNQVSGVIGYVRIDTTYYYEQPTTPTGMSSGAVWYNNSPSVNKCYKYNGSTWDEYPFVVLADFSYTGGAISDFNAVYPVELVKKNDSNWVSRQGKPSKRYVSLTLGASGATYKAPANGYFSAASPSGGVRFMNLTTLVKNSGLTLAGNWGGACSVPAKAGDSVQFDYGGGSGYSAQFIFDEGNFNV